MDMGQEARRKAERLELLLTIQAFYDRRESRLKARGFTTFPARYYYGLQESLLPWAGKKVILKKKNINTDDDEQWITTKNGAHILLGEGGEIKAGLGGEHTGENMSELSSDHPSNEEARRKIVNGDYSTRINRGRQRKHIEGTKEFQQLAEKMDRQSPGSKPAILAVDAQSLIGEFAGNGEVYFKQGEQFPREKVSIGKVAGKTWVKSMGKYVDTDTITIVYSSDGVHVFPRNAGNR
jgi:hypothetical protein